MSPKLRPLIRCCDCQNLTVVAGEAGCGAPRPWWAERRESQFAVFTMTEILERHHCDTFELKEVTP